MNPRLSSLKKMRYYQSMLVLRLLLLAYSFSVLFFSCGQVKFAGNDTSSETPATPKPPGPVQTFDVSTTLVVIPPNNKLDILLVIDDSNSMLADNLKLAQKLSPFVESLQNSAIDWQMCGTLTRALTTNNVLTWGTSFLWSNYVPASGIKNWVLRPTTNLATVFTNTINTIGAGWNGTDDERAIRAAWSHLYNGDPKASNNSTCYRSDAALSVIAISDEDERSVGGIKALEFYKDEYKPLENEDLPETLLKQVTDTFSDKKRFTFNSIIVKPADTACMAEQDKQGTKSHIGTTYAKLSKLTGGGIGSICDSDFSANLNLFKDIIETSIASFPLQCSPVGDVTASVAPSFTFTYKVQGQSVVFTPALPAGRKLTLTYKCTK